MGVTGLLKSDLFGLSSTLDPETERRLLRRNELFVKPDRTPAEDTHLKFLSAELADLGFSTSDFRDRDYTLFVQKMAQHRKYRKPALTSEERAEQDRIADEVIDEILQRRGRGSDLIDLENKKPTDEDIPGWTPGRRSSGRLGWKNRRQLVAQLLQYTMRQEIATRATS